MLFVLCKRQLTFVGIAEDILKREWEWTENALEGRQQSTCVSYSGS